MSFWQFQAAVIGVHRANSPEDETATAPMPGDLLAALANSRVH